MSYRGTKRDTTRLWAKIGKPIRQLESASNCGSTADLTEEHIVPLALNGDIVLPKASCLKHNAVTCAFEGSVLRGDIKHVRAALGFRTRRPKEMPKTLPLLVTMGGKEKTIHVPVSDSLVILPFPLFLLPAFLEGRESKPGVEIRGFVSIHFGADPNELMRRYGAEKVGTILRTDSVAFARMLAKIAYSTVVAELGYDALIENFVLKAILGETDDIGRWVGSVGEETQPTISAIQHSVQYAVYTKGDESLLIGQVKLFSNTQAPAYMVVLGRPRPGLKLPPKPKLPQSS